MLDRMEQMARSGQKDAARRMLQELQQMLDNLPEQHPLRLQGGQPGGRGVEQVGGEGREEQAGHHGGGGGVARHERQHLFGPPRRPLTRINLELRPGGEVWAVGKG